MSDQLAIVPIEQQEPQLPSPQLSRMVNLEELWDIFVRIRGDLMPKTLYEYGTIGRRFCKFMAGRKLEPQEMLNWVRYLQDFTNLTLKGERKLKAYYINAINTRVRSFLRWLRRMGYFNTYLDEVIPTLATPAPPEVVIVTEEEYNTVKAWCKGRPWCQTHLWLIILSYRTGMSLVDCCNLRWKDVHLHENAPSYIDIYRIKTRRLGGKALCNIPLLPFNDLWYWIEYLKKREHLNYKRFDGITDFVHQDAPGLHQCQFSTIHMDFKNIFERAGVHGKRFKHLRSAFCSYLVNSNTNIALICKMTGHNNVTTLLRYLKPDRRALQDGLMRAQNMAAESAGIGKGSDGIIRFEDILKDME